MFDAFNYNVSLPAQSRLSRNVSYYIIGQASKYIPAGAQRVESIANLATIKTVGFILPNGKKACLVLNTGSAVTIILLEGKENIKINMAAQSASTIVW
jgi:glucosylceramidase